LRVPEHHLCLSGFGLRPALGNAISLRPTPLSGVGEASRLKGGNRGESFNRGVR
jgi:hypothetical protein